MKFDEQLDVYLRARFTLIILITPKEDRSGGRGCRSWWF